MKIAEMTVTQLEHEKVRVETRLAETKKERTEMAAHLTAVVQELAQRKRTPAEPRMSDHALLRYIERVCEIDVEEIRQSIMTPGVIEGIKMGCSKVKKDGVEFRVQNNTIVTVI